MPLSEDRTVVSLLRDLLSRLARAPDDDEAWSELYVSQWPFVFAINYRLLRGQRDLAEDLSQDVFIRLRRYCPFARLREPASFRAYLAAVCRNVFRSYLRQSLSRGEIGLEELGTGGLSLLSVDTKADEQLEADELLRDFLGALAPRDRRLLRYLIDGHSLKEIAKATGWSYTNAGVRVYRLRRQLRQYTKERYREGSAQHRDP